KEARSTLLLIFNVPCKRHKLFSPAYFLHSRSGAGPTSPAHSLFCPLPLLFVPNFHRLTEQYGFHLFCHYSPSLTRAHTKQYH
ncbi:unnamed protein product, partial [Musa acuminata subsp. malaccensis]